MITGLTNGGSYRFTVQATNANGPSPVSAPSAPIIVGQPGKPGAVTAVPGSGRATVTWTKPTVTYGIPITAYDVGVYINNKLVSHKTVHGSSTSRVVTGLKNKVLYTFAVTALNSTSTGVRSGLSPVIVVGAPRAPTGVTATAARKAATVRWKTPASNGNAIRGYLVFAYANGQLVGSRGSAGTKTVFTFPGLTTGRTYTFRVMAVNGRGRSPASLPSKGVKIK